MVKILSPYLLILLLIFVFKVNAQTKLSLDSIEVTFGPKTKNKKYEIASKIVGDKTIGYYKISHPHWTKGEVYINHYNEELMRVHKSRIDLKYEGIKRKYVDIISLNERLFVLTSHADKRSNKKKLLLDEVDINSLGFIGKSKTLSEIDFKYTKYSGEFNLKFSPDTSHVLIHYNEQDGFGNDIRYGFDVFNDEFQLQWHKETPVPYYKKRFDNQKHTVTNLGNVYMVGRLFKKTRDISIEGNPNYLYKIYRFAKEDSQNQEYSIEFNNYFIDDLFIVSDHNNKLYCAGFYSMQENKLKHGVIMIKLDDQTGERIFKQTDFLEADIYKDDAIDHIGASYIIQYKLKQLFIQESGDLVLIAEQVYYGPYTMDNSSQFSSSTAYTNNNVLILSYNSFGERRWISKIMKNQYALGDHYRYTSYFVFQRKQDLVFLYRDTPRDFEPIQLSAQSLFKMPAISKIEANHMIMKIIEVHDDGIQSETSYVHYKHTDAYPVIGLSLQISPDEILLINERLKKTSLSFIEFRE